MEETKVEEIQPEIKQKSKKMPFTNHAMLFTHGCNNAVSVFVTTFLISYIYEISANYVLNIGLFYASNYLIMGLVLFLISHLVDKSNRVIFYRLAIVLRAVFIVCVVFVGEKLAELVILAGALHGTADAIYWASLNVMKNELISSRFMKKFSTLQISIEKLVNFVLPIILGKLIDSASFKSSAYIVLVIAVIQMVMSFFIKSNRPENSKFDFKGFLNDVKTMGEKKKLIRLCWLCSAFLGVLTVETCINTIFVMMTMKSNFALGLVTGIFSLISIIVLVLMRRFVKTGKRAWIYILCSILPVVSALLIVFVTRDWAIVIHNFVFIVANTIYSYLHDVYRNIIIKKLGFYDDIAEYQCSVSLVIEFSRVATFAVMAIIGAVCASFGVSGILIGLKAFFFVSILGFPAINWVLYKFEKNLIKMEILK